MEKGIINTITLSITVGFAILLIGAGSILDSALETSYAYPEVTEENVKKEEETKIPEEESVLTENFTQITFSEYLDLIKEEKPIAVYIGRDTCGTCRSFIPVLDDIILNNPGLTIYHIPSDSIDFTSTEYLEFEIKDNILKETFMYVPILIITNNDQILHASNGFKNTEEVETLLKENNVL